MKYLTLALLTTLSLSLRAQDDLMALLGDDAPQQDLAYATFKTTRVVNGQSIENPAPGVLLFIISHHFGTLNTGPYELFGLDQSTIRFGLEYGLNDHLALGFGRSSWEKTYDGFLKLKLLRQQTGKRNIPLSLSWFSSVALNSLKWQDTERENYFSSRLSYVHQLLMARKFSPGLSLQLSPSIIHKNLVPAAIDKNTAFALGIGGRAKLTQRTAFNFEYFYLLPDQYVNSVNNSLSLGFDIETGGHVFQLHFSNSKPMFERGFITETQGKWSRGDIFFGFNITRVFTMRKPEAFRSAD
ncbi:MAG TPA: DUF5777 family beta-barrel protein [Bacteroidales bacterium]|nr:DUF5777 family beta-barrel protein [Bacteroidales bacterium]HRZ76371.1 DUF5777 family beta-barrel protein [Bacteroidales bacterium]